VVGHLEEGIETVWNSTRIKQVRAALADHRFDEACRCGANMSVSGKNSDPEHFFTRYRNQAFKPI
jgi:hypothetical protein